MLLSRKDFADIQWTGAKLGMWLAGDWDNGRETPALRVINAAAQGDAPIKGVTQKQAADALKRVWTSKWIENEMPRSNDDSDSVDNATMAFLRDGDQSALFDSLRDGADQNTVDLCRFIVVGDIPDHWWMNPNTSAILEKAGHSEHPPETIDF